MLPTRRISPLGTYQTVPLRSRSRVTRRRDRLDGADGLADVDHVADAVLVLEDHEDAGQEVLDQRLRTEAERDADDPGAGDDRGDVDADLAEDHGAEDRDQDARDHALQDAADGLGALRPARGRPRRSTRSGRTPFSARRTSRSTSLWKHPADDQPRMTQPEQHQGCPRCRSAPSESARSRSGRRPGCRALAVVGTGVSVVNGGMRHASQYRWPLDRAEGLVTDIVAP